MKKFLKNFFWVTLGGALYSFGFSVFISPNNLAPGGLSGIAVLLRQFLPVPTGTLVLIMNLPLLIIGLIKFGKSFLMGTIYGTVLTSMLINLFIYVNDVTGGALILTDDLLLSALAGGAAIGLGLGIVFRFGATTGGTDIIVRLVKNRFRYFKSGTIMVSLDAAIIIASAFVFKNVDLALYAALALVVESFTMNSVLYGSDSARLVYIISEKNYEIAECLLNDLNLGATFVEGVGAYTKKDQQVLMVAVRKRLFPRLKTKVETIDDRSFMIVSSASEIFGEGFKMYGGPEV